ncbi:MAG: hypothetical protein QM757_05490 [Paludibaculum sp.]
MISLGLEAQFQADAQVSARLPLMTEEVRRGHISSFSAARELLALFHPAHKGSE